MRKVFAVVVAFVVFSIANEARACQACVYPPPYLPKCGSTICGGEQCWLMPGWGCVILQPGMCSENDSFCGSSERRPEQVWACAPRLQRELKLISVRIKRDNRDAV